MAAIRAGRLTYRRRRRAVIVAAVGIVAGGVAAAVTLLPTAEHTSSGARPDGRPAAASTPASPVDEPPDRQPTAAEQKEILATMSLFITTAVSRHHPERAYGIVDVSLREGMTKKQWSTGSIPVVPYPARGVDLIKFDRFRGDRALVEVLLEPTNGSHLVRKTFQIELHRSPAAKWLVSAWVPEGVSESQINLNRPQSPDVIAKAANPPHLSAEWIYLPLGFLLLGLLLTPVVLFGHHAYASRRAEKKHRRSLQSEDLPPYELRR